MEAKDSLLVDSVPAMHGQGSSLAMNNDDECDMSWAVDSDVESESSYSDTHNHKSKKEAKMAEMKEIEDMARNETRSLYMWRIVLLFAILLTGTVASVGAFLYLQHQQHGEAIASVRRRSFARVYITHSSLCLMMHPHAGLRSSISLQRLFTVPRTSTLRILPCPCLPWPRPCPLLEGALRMTFPLFVYPCTKYQEVMRAKYPVWSTYLGNHS
jgi:hypothetical protein